MTPTELETAIQVANRIFSRDYIPEIADTPAAELKPVPCRGLNLDDCAEQCSWPTEGLDPEQRFHQAHSKLFLFIGRKVRTPGGPGTLLQVFAERVTVLLDSERDKCSFFVPAQVKPVITE
jgi:hypothetical protein